jgi:hypothetical protein
MIFLAEYDDWFIVLKIQDIHFTGDKESGIKNVIMLNREGKRKFGIKQRSIEQTSKTPVLFT